MLRGSARLPRSRHIPLPRRCLWCLRAPSTPDRPGGQHDQPFIDHAAQSGIDHIVFSSVAGAESNRIVLHHRIEQHLSASGVGWTILRPGFFTQNLETAYRADIVEDDRIFVPAGEGRVAFVDTRDIGEVAAVALTEPSHRGMAYHLTGPEAIDFHRIAEILTHALSRETSYEPAGIPSYLTHLITRGLTPPHAIVQTILHAGLRRGDAAPVTDTIERLLGRQPRGVEEYVLDRARLFWKRPGI